MTLRDLSIAPSRAGRPEAAVSPASTPRPRTRRSASTTKHSSSWSTSPSSSNGAGAHPRRPPRLPPPPGPPGCATRDPRESPRPSYDRSRLRVRSGALDRADRDRERVLHVLTQAYVTAATPAGPIGSSGPIAAGSTPSCSSPTAGHRSRTGFAALVESGGTLDVLPPCGVLERAAAWAGGPATPTLLANIRPNDVASVLALPTRAPGGRSRPPTPTTFWLAASAGPAVLPGIRRARGPASRPDAARGTILPSCRPPRATVSRADARRLLGIRAGTGARSRPRGSPGGGAHRLGKRSRVADRRAAAGSSRGLASYRDAGPRAVARIPGSRPAGPRPTPPARTYGRRDLGPRPAAGRARRRARARSPRRSGECSRAGCQRRRPAGAGRPRARGRRRAAGRRACRRTRRRSGEASPGSVPCPGDEDDRVLPAAIGPDDPIGTSGCGRRERRPG